jgi:hypothetical protein
VKADIEAKKLEIDHFKAETDRLKVLADIASRQRTRNSELLNTRPRFEQSGHLDSAESHETEQADKALKARCRLHRTLRLQPNLRIIRNWDV